VLRLHWPAAALWCADTCQFVRFTLGFVFRPLGTARSSSKSATDALLIRRKSSGRQSDEKLLPDEKLHSYSHLAMCVLNRCFHFTEDRACGLLPNVWQIVVLNALAQDTMEPMAALRNKKASPSASDLPRHLYSLISHFRISASVVQNIFLLIA
jgi:hypothetical protein